MKSNLSVILCTHNPRKDYINRVLDALKAQTLPIEKWELLLVDNASDQSLKLEIDLSWHPYARHIREDQLGLTPARLRGIREANGEIIVFVDDDNVLDADYLEVAQKIGQEYLFLGAWGGQIRGEFEVPPPEWAKPFLPKLAIREFDRDQWSNLLHQHQTTPCGAGLCIRKFIAEKYAEQVRSDVKRLNLDRKGQSLFSGGDTDLAFTACDLGLGTGQFTALKLAHLMPPQRLEEGYLLKLIEGSTYSNIILDSLRGRMPNPLNISWKERLREFYRLLKMGAWDRRFYQADKRGQIQAIQELSSEREMARSRA